MKRHVFITLLAVILTGAFFTPSVQAQEPTTGELEVAVVTPTVDALTPAVKDPLSTRHADFTDFAHKRVATINENHQYSKSRMIIIQQADGTYLARYHFINAETLDCKVRRSKSKTIPFVGVLAYHETIMEAVAESPEACRDATFNPVSIIPNRHIYSYKQGAWQ